MEGRGAAESAEEVEGEAEDGQRDRGEEPEVRGAHADAEREPADHRGVEGAERVVVTHEGSRESALGGWEQRGHVECCRERSLRGRVGGEGGDVHTRQ